MMLVHYKAVAMGSGDTSLGFGGASKITLTLIRRQSHREPPYSENNSNCCATLPLPCSVLPTYSEVNPSGATVRGAVWPLQSVGVS